MKNVRETAAARSLTAGGSRRRWRAGFIPRGASAPQFGSAGAAEAPRGPKSALQRPSQILIELLRCVSVRALIVVLFTVFAAHTEILDRIAVSVGKQVITERDVLRELRVTAFLDHRQPVENSDQKRAAADRLIDRMLILDEAALTRVTLSSNEEARKMLDDVKAQYGTDYQATLARYRITEQNVANQLIAGLHAMRFADLRFRPEVQLSDDDLRDFYNTLAAQWKQSGKAEIPSFESSRDQVEKLLADQRTAQALDRWLGTRRTETQILYHQQVFR